MAENCEKPCGPVQEKYTEWFHLDLYTDCDSADLRDEYKSAMEKIDYSMHKIDADSSAALDLASQANKDAAEALEHVNEAFVKADHAEQVAEEAKTLAEAAQATADEAKDTADHNVIKIAELRNEFTVEKNANAEKNAEQDTRLTTLEERVEDHHTRLGEIEHDIEDLQNHDAQQDGTLNAHTGQIANLYDEVHTNQAAIATNKADIADIRRVDQGQDAKIKALEDRAGAIETKDIQQDGRLDALEKRATDIETVDIEQTRRLNALDAKTDATNTAAAALTTRVAKNETDIAALDTRLDQVETQGNTLREEVTALNTLTQQHSAKLMELETEIDDNAEHIRTINTTLNDLDGRVTTNADDIADLVANLTDETTERQNADAATNTKVTELETQLGELATKVDGIVIPETTVAIQVTTDTNDPAVTFPTIIFQVDGSNNVVAVRYAKPAEPAE